jgi:hypothetical protein
MFPVVAYVNVAVSHLKHCRAALYPYGVRPGASKTQVWGKLAIWAIFLCVAPKLVATTIVVIRTDTGFVVAADSGLSDNHGKPLPQLACKVFTTDNTVVWGFGGLMGGWGFDPASDLRRLVGPNLDIVSKRMQADIIPMLTEEAKRIRVTDPAKFEFLMSGNDIFQVFVAIGKRSILHGYKVTIGENGEISVASSGTIDCVGGTPSCPPGKIMRIGEDAEIVRFLAAHPVAMQQFSSYGDLAKFLVGLEVDSSPDTVRLPIDSVEVAGKGIIWGQRKPECSTTDKGKDGR